MAPFLGRRWAFIFLMLLFCCFALHHPSNAFGYTLTVNSTLNASTTPGALTTVSTNDGSPVVSHLKKIHIGGNVSAQVKHDGDAEECAIKSYNDSVRLAVDLGCNGTRNLLGEILKGEEEHVDWIEGQQVQIKQMGVQTYLAEQIG